MKNPEWNRAQCWKENLPDPFLVGRAANDFANEAADVFRSVLPENLTAVEKIRLRADYQAAMVDAYMTGVIEYAKALTTGTFYREPWGDDIDGEKVYKDWWNALPEASALAVQQPELPAGDYRSQFRPNLGGMAATSEYLDLYCRQPCEAYGVQLANSMARWSGDETWRHAGLGVAVADELGRRFTHFRRLKLWYQCLRLFRSRHAATWNDYHIVAWKMRRDAPPAFRIAPVVELHRRCHLTGARWQAVASSGLWAMASMRAQYPEFEADYRAGVVACETCDKLAVSAREQQPARAGGNCGDDGPSGDGTT